MGIIYNPPQPPATSYSPALQGATDNPTPTYSVRVGSYYLIGKLCYFTLNITTTTMTKSTLTDNIRISLPFTSASTSNLEFQVASRIENGTPVANGNLGAIAPNTAYIEFKNLPLVAASTALTYALTSLGVLTNTINFRASGYYETA